MADDFTLEIRRFDPVDKRLGRHVVHDSRSLRFRAPSRDPRKLASVRHRINIPILDQGDVGSCTGHAGTAAIASDPFWSGGSLVLATTDPHEYAVGLYSAATELDPWPGQWRPDDTGSDGLSIAKVLQARGLISGYQHATSLDAVLTALAKQVVLIGSSWYSGMYEVSADGQMNVSGGTLGGHEYALDELDVERQRVWMRNSWGEGYGIRGRASMSWDDLGRLLADFGDCTVLIPREQPAPQPVPEPEPVKPDPAADKPMAAALRKYLDNRNAARYMRDAGESWLKGR